MTTSRWTRYGKDRVYVTAADGTKVGWLDLLTGGEHVEDPTQLEGFRAAVAPFRPGIPPPDAPTSPTGQVPPPAPAVAVPTLATPPVASAPPDPAGPGWEDLAERIPGQGVRANAEAELAAMKQRSRVRTFLARTLDVHTDERAWRVGAEGEENVGAKLAKLEQRGWHVLHSIPVRESGTDIDHLLIGPAGVYTINTKTHMGKQVTVYEHALYVNGHKQHYLPAARSEARRVSRTLTTAVGFPVDARPVLVILTGILSTRVEVKHQPDGVAVLTGWDLPKVFTRAPTRLTPEQIDTIYSHARRSTTWIP